MHAKNLMTFRPLTVGPGTLTKDVARRMLAQEAHALPVVDPEGRVVGIVTDREVLQAMRPPSPSVLRGGRPAAEALAPRVAMDIMSRTVVCTSVDADAAELAGLMIDNDVRHVVVLDQGRLVGIVSSFDVLRAIARPDADIERDVLGLLDGLADPVMATLRVQDGVVVVDPSCDEGMREKIRAAARLVPGVIGLTDAPVTIGLRG